MNAKASHIGSTRIIDTVELSDAFRRHAACDKPAIVARLVAEVRAVAVLSTHYDYDDTSRHADLVYKLQYAVTRAARLARHLGGENLVLPIDGREGSVFARFFQTQVMTAAFSASLPLKVSLQDSMYSNDMSALGPIDPGIATALDKGVRGVAYIQSNLKDKWSA